DEQLDVAPGQGRAERTLVWKELVDRTDGNTGSLGDPGRGERLVSALVEQLRTGVGHPLHPSGTTALGGTAAQGIGRPRTYRCVTFPNRMAGHSSILPLSPLPGQGLSISRLKGLSISRLICRRSRC